MKIQTTLVASLLVLSANAYAEHPPGGERHWRGPISISEVEQETEQRFVKLDTNGDDQITADEFDAAEMHRPGRRGPMSRRFHGDGPDRELRHAEIEAEVFAELDADGNGELSQDEYSAENQRAAKKAVMQQHMFSRMDQNDDGVIDRDEFREPAKRLTELDTDGNGEVTRDELRAGFRTRFHQAS